MSSKNILVISVICFLMACNANDSSSKENIVNTADTEEHNHENAVHGLALNDGAKWHADMPTNENVKALQTIAADFNKSYHTALGDYQKVSDELKSGLDKMIKECRMKGADHDALHKWLEPLLQQVQALEAARETKDAKELFDEIRKQLMLYDQYFE